jgi:hypothetical protein
MNFAQYEAQAISWLLIANRIPSEEYSKEFHSNFVLILKNQFQCQKL